MLTARVLIDKVPLQRLISYLTSLTALTWLVIPLIKASPVLAQYYTPPDMGLPGRREGSGSRGTAMVSPLSLTALSPENSFGLTVAERPTFFFYVPQLLDQDEPVVEFVLLDEATNTVVYETTIVTTAVGVLQVELPETVLPLEVDKPYHWYFSIIIDATDRSSDLFVDGWVQRVIPDSELAAKLAVATPGDRPTLYASTGIWYDALAELAELRRSHPDDSTWNEQWTNLLHSVGLANIADQPMIENSQSSADEPMSESIDTPHPASENRFLPADSGLPVHRQGGGQR